MQLLCLLVVFFYLIMTGNNLSVIALSVGGNGPPINPKKLIRLILY